MVWSTYISCLYALVMGCGADVRAAVELLKSNRPALPKLLWCVGVFVFPVGGLIIYWLFSNRAEHNTSGGYESIA